MKLGARSCARRRGRSGSWGLDLAVAICLGVGVVTAAVAVCDTRMWDAAEQRARSAASRRSPPTSPASSGSRTSSSTSRSAPASSSGRSATIHAVDGVDLTIHKGETLGLVGESGCGKTTLSRTILKLVEPTSGRIYFNGRDISRSGRRRMRAVRREMQIVFQDPYASLNPRMTVRDIIGEPLRIQRRLSAASAGKQRVDELLRTVGLSPEHANRFPHEFSGGQRQRIGVARALALEPAGDHPRRAGVGARRLDPRAGREPARVAAARLRADVHLRRARPLRRAARVRSRRRDVPRQDRRDRRRSTRSTTSPSHPYTQALLSAVPIEEPSQRGKRKRIVLEGDVPSPANPPSGCRFRTRCWKAQPICAEEEPALIDRGQGHPSRLPLRRDRASPLDLVSCDASGSRPTGTVPVTDLRRSRAERVAPFGVIAKVGTDRSVVDERESAVEPGASAVAAPYPVGRARCKTRLGPDCGRRIGMRRSMCPSDSIGSARYRSPWRCPSVHASVEALRVRAVEAAACRAGGDSSSTSRRRW